MAEYNGYQEGRNHSRTTGWYGGVSSPSLNISLYPIDGLTVNLAFPFSSQTAGFTFLKFEANIVYLLEGIGNVYLSYQSNTGYLKGDADAWYGADGVTDVNASPKVFASFYLTAIENMAVDLGVAYKFPFNNEDDKTVTNHPFEVGLGYRINLSSDFQFKLRAAVSLGSGTVVDGDETTNKPLQFSASILPNYKFKGFTAFFYAGVGVRSVKDFEDDDGIYFQSGNNAVVAWFVNPYVFIPAGPLRLKVGLQVWSDGVRYRYEEDDTGKLEKPDYAPAKIGWSIPIGFYAYF